MEYHCSDSFPFDFERNGISNLVEILSPRSYPTQYERKWNKEFSQCTVIFGLSCLDFCIDSRSGQGISAKRGPINYLRTILVMYTGVSGRPSIGPQVAERR